MRIAVCGSTLLGDDLKEKAEELGKAIGKKKHDVLIGVGAQVPYQVATQAHAHGSRIISYSPHVLPLEEEELECLDAYDKQNIVESKIYLPNALSNIEIEARTKMRNLTMIGDADSAVIIAGKWGTVTEFGLARSRDIPIGLLKNTGGAADALLNLTKLLENTKKPTGISYTDDPKAMIEQLEDLQRIFALKKARL